MCAVDRRNRIHWKTPDREAVEVNYPVKDVKRYSNSPTITRIGVSQIYLIARPKKTKTAAERVAELSKGPVFDRIRKLDPEFLSRITPVDGDLENRNLGLTEAAQEELIQHTEIILHAAADVRFDETLKNAIQVNIRATRDLFEMAKKMPKLQVSVV